MAVDLQTVFPQDVITVAKSSFSTLNGALALDILGDDFRDADEVRVNDITCPDFLVKSRTRLVAQLPDSMQNSPTINTIVVLSRTLMVTAKSLLRFRIGDTPGAVSGVMRLLQLFVKLLLSDPGTDIFNKNLGGGALKNIGTSFSAGDAQAIKADFVIAVDRVSRHIVGLQSRNGTLPRDERLLNARLTGATFSRVTGSLFVNIEVLSQLGTSARVNLEL